MLLVALDHLVQHILRTSKAHALAGNLRCQAEHALARAPSGGLNCRHRLLSIGTDIQLIAHQLARGKRLCIEFVIPHMKTRGNHFPSFIFI